MDLGIFDHLDRQGNTPLADFYDSRLRLLEKYDAAGFYSYHLAEHHATPLGLAPVPGIFLAAATQRTRHIRLGPCVYCLPLYDPLRLIEEVCMLDHLSRGRFDFGVGRGIVPYEMAYFDLHHMETEEIYREGLDVILQGLTSDVLDHRGRRYTYRKVPMILRPLQAPHPPLWYGLGHLAGAEWAATHRVNVIANNTADATRPLFDRYREVWQKEHGDPPLPKLGIGRHVVVAPTEAEAEAIGRPAYAIWYGNLTKLWRDFGALPIRFARDFDEARQRGIAIAGTPAHVRQEIERQIATSTANYFVCRLMFGEMTEAEASASIDLFTAEVMPHIARLK
jgi:alkanesulfonate monooxygenase SsuD/methylene tetrahydromethanopterin reductase-like flavin-dependent oxidoreductase (luciferase family)